MVDLIERLKNGVVSTGDLHDDNETELFHVDDASETMAEAADRIAALEAQLAERVKPLKWLNVRVNYGPETYEAKTPVGFYQVFTDEDSAAGSVFAEWAWNQNQFGMTGATSLGRYASFPSAKAAAQADFDRRILSALVSRTRDASSVVSHETANVRDKPSALEATPPAPTVTDEMVAAALKSLHCNPVSWDHPSAVRAALTAAQEASR